MAWARSYGGFDAAALQTATTMAMDVGVAGFLGDSDTPQQYVSLHAAGVPPGQSLLWDVELDDVSDARWAEVPFSRDTIVVVNDLDDGGLDPLWAKVKATVARGRRALVLMRNDQRKTSKELRIGLGRGAPRGSKERLGLDLSTGEIMLGGASSVPSALIDDMPEFVIELCEEIMGSAAPRRAGHPHAAALAAAAVAVATALVTRTSCAAPGVAART